MSNEPQEPISNQFSSDYINRVSLEYLLNKEQYNTLVGRETIKKTNKRDVKFYKKRIFNLTRELLTTSDKPEMLPPDVRQAFETYTHFCIEYFKILDNNDILQEDYSSIIEHKDDTVFIETQQEADKLLMRSIQLTNNSLDAFVKKKVIKQKDIILPQKKEINLKDPDLKIKGIPKKKNITNKYGETKKDDTKEKNKPKKEEPTEEPTQKWKK
jgi:hypothetical protein